ENLENDQESILPADLALIPLFTQPSLSDFSCELPILDDQGTSVPAFLTIIKGPEMGESRSTFEL
ncbi:unnamed protein product, partial [marine sediment metagenome]